MANNKKIFKEFWNKWRPDTNNIKFGDGSNELSWKVRGKKVKLQFKKEFENDVDITVFVKATGEIYKLKMPKTIEAEIKASKKVSF